MAVFNKELYYKRRIKICLQDDNDVKNICQLRQYEWIAEIE